MKRVTPPDPHDGYEDACARTMRNIPQISKPFTIREFARKYRISIKDAKLEVKRAGHMQLSKRYWQLAQEYEMVRGTAIEELLRRGPIRGWKALDDLRTFSAAPTRENLIVHLHHQGYEDIIAVGVLQSCRRFSVSKLLYYYPSR